MIKSPPTLIQNPFARIISDHADQADAYLELAQPFDAQGRYLHFDTLRFRFPKSLNADLAWSVVRQARNRQLMTAISLSEPSRPCGFLYTPAMQMAVSACDQNTTTAALEWMCSRIGESRQLKYLLNDLVEDEAISSSQLEGAATTTKVAKELLKRKRGARTQDEKMIIGNFRMMQHAWEFRDQELSLELLTDLHQVGVEGIEDERYRPGELRSVDDVVVEDGNGNIVHQPPPAHGIQKRLLSVVAWANKEHSHIDSPTYIHPLIKAIILHFVIGYEHPFHDGNGRVARSLFYWYLFKCGFGGFRYLAISRLLKIAPVKYGKSYLYTETDDMDLTYFIDYQCQVIARAIQEFTRNHEAAVAAIDRFNALLYESGLYAKLSDKQRIIFNAANSSGITSFTVTDVKNKLGCAYNTAATVLNGLVDLQLFHKVKTGSEWVYSMIDTTQTVKSRP
ncbi:Fic family protein [Pseudomonas syringae]|uniref:Filamentation induced by cAMP protein fic n=3 Tax=Pseudomonas syringae TaxID=317 RepID=A0A656JYJ2_PSESF|nr:Fic family protein [Pseudomonas syringae]EPN61396.1 filamentation induced by cAMP protein fic [Pseudomonas syringae pv. actinidiae ICMP 19096]EPM45805.1 filamentation induced by cAMP protein fic [Pseudomonas syringae pv. actinidiae ICMP 19098]EPM87638.1 filamentation induced by cAMP protein fic [Pseudomonas syringae pv. actinidiae ICMP 18804]EPN17286.1 filamentation induced by cAMP protein fic [Pseudomonas syringae pv. actinidiae ICMP 19100]EPN24971.1 filamentation induced by cAMP protein f